MIYLVMAAVFGFAGWQIFRFVRRLRRDDCPAGYCPAYSVQDCGKKRRMEQKKEEGQPV